MLRDVWMQNNEDNEKQKKIESFIKRAKNMKRYQSARWEKLDELRDEIEIFQRRELPAEMHFDLEYPSSTLEIDENDFYEEDIWEYFEDDVDYFISNLSKQLKELQEYGPPLKKEKDEKKEVKEEKPEEEEKKELVESIRYFFANIPCTSEERKIYIKGVIMGILYIGIPFFAVIVSLIIALILK